MASPNDTSKVPNRKDPSKRLSMDHTFNKQIEKQLQDKVKQIANSGSNPKAKNVKDKKDKTKNKPTKPSSSNPGKERSKAAKVKDITDQLKAQNVPLPSEGFRTELKEKTKTIRTLQLDNDSEDSLEEEYDTQENSSASNPQPPPLSRTRSVAQGRKLSGGRWNLKALLSGMRGSKQSTDSIGTPQLNGTDKSSPEKTESSSVDDVPLRKGLFGIRNKTKYAHRRTPSHDPTVMTSISHEKRSDTSLKSPSQIAVAPQEKIEAAISAWAGDSLRVPKKKSRLGIFSGSGTVRNKPVSEKGTTLPPNITATGTWSSQARQMFEQLQQEEEELKKLLSNPRANLVQSDEFAPNPRPTSADFTALATEYKPAPPPLVPRPDIPNRRPSMTISSPNPATLPQPKPLPPPLRLPSPATAPLPPAIRLPPPLLSQRVESPEPNLTQPSRPGSFLSPPSGSPSLNTSPSDTPNHPVTSDGDDGIECLIDAATAETVDDATEPSPPFPHDPPAQDVCHPKTDIHLAPLPPPLVLSPGELTSRILPPPFMSIPLPSNLPSPPESTPISKPLVELDQKPVADGSIEPSSIPIEAPVSTIAKEPDSVLTDQGTASDSTAPDQELAVEAPISTVIEPPSIIEPVINTDITPPPSTQPPPLPLDPDVLALLPLDPDVLLPPTPPPIQPTPDQSLSPSHRPRSNSEADALALLYSVETTIEKPHVDDELQILHELQANIDAQAALNDLMFHQDDSGDAELLRKAHQELMAQEEADALAELRMLDQPGATDETLSALANLQTQIPLTQFPLVGKQTSVELLFPPELRPQNFPKFQLDPEIGFSLKGKILEVVEALGSGATASVWKGLIDGHVVALKQFEMAHMDKKKSRDLRQSLKIEVDMMKDQTHPNILRYFGSFFSRKTMELNVVVEYISHGDITARLGAKGLNECVSAHIIHQTLLGLQFLHSHNILHRDIKPDNLLLDFDGSIKLADFGIAAQLEDHTDRRMSSVGTPWYTAPEVINGEEYSFGCDIWSTGCTLFELLTGKPPYAEANPMVAVYKMTENPHPPLPDTVSPLCKEFLLCTWVRDTQQRPSASDILCHPWLTSFMITGFENTVFQSSSF